MTRSSSISPGWTPSTPPAIGNLVAVLESVGRRNGVVCFSNLLAPNRQVLDVLDISNAVLIFDEEEQAVQHFARQR